MLTRWCLQTLNPVTHWGKGGLRGKSPPKAKVEISLRKTSPISCLLPRRKAHSIWDVSSFSKYSHNCYLIWALQWPWEVNKTDAVNPILQMCHLKSRSKLTFPGILLVRKLRLASRPPYSRSKWLLLDCASSQFLILENFLHRMIIYPQPGFNFSRTQ